MRSTIYSLQNMSIVDWFSSSITFLRFISMDASWFFLSSTLDEIFRHLLYYHTYSWGLIAVVDPCKEHLEPFLWFHEVVVELKMIISIPILAIWVGEVGVFIIHLLYLLSKVHKGLFNCLQDIVYIRLVLSAGFDWLNGYQLLFIVILISSLLGIVSSMRWWVPC